MLTGVQIVAQHIDASRLHLVDAKALTEIGRKVFWASKDRAQQNHCGITLQNQYKPLPPYKDERYSKAKKDRRPDLTLTGLMWSSRSMGIKIVRTSNSLGIEIYFKGSNSAPKFTLEQIKALTTSMKTSNRLNALKAMSERLSPAGKAGAYVKRHGVYLLGVTSGDIAKIKTVAEAAMQVEMHRVQRFKEVTI